MENNQKEEIVSTGKYLTGEQYWKWRFFACNISSNELKYKECESKLTSMAKELEIAKLRLELYKLTVLKNAKEEHENSVKMYQEEREILEKEIEIELKNCVIDDHTFEVKKLVVSK